MIGSKHASVTKVAMPWRSLEERQLFETILNGLCSMNKAFGQIMSTLLPLESKVRKAAIATLGIYPPGHIAQHIDLILERLGGQLELSRRPLGNLVAPVRGLLARGPRGDGTH